MIGRSREPHDDVQGRAAAIDDQRQPSSRQTRFRQARSRLALDGPSARAGIGSCMSIVAATAISAAPTV